MKKLFHREDKSYKYDFLPSALEIIEKPASPYGKIIIYIVTILVAAAIIWASVSKIDNVIISSGTVNVENGIKIVDSNVNGQITSIKAKEGEQIKKGDTLLELDNVNGKQSIHDIEVQIKENQMQTDVINSRLNGNTYDDIFYKYKDIDDSKKEEIKLQADMEEDEYQNKCNSYLKEINDDNEKIGEYQNEINNINQDNAKTHDNNKISQNSNEISVYNKDINDLKNSIDDCKEKLKNEKDSYKLKLYQSKNNYKDRLEKLNSDLMQLKDNDNKYNIKSPIDGQILTLNYNTIGSYINASKEIAQIIPKDSKLEIETYVNNSDISKIKKGEKVIIKLSAYDYQKYGTLKGNVKSIAPSSILNKKGNIVYKVKVSFNKNQNKNITVMSGMTASLEIKTGKQRIIQYFLEPFNKTIDNALKG